MTSNRTARLPALPLLTLLAAAAYAAGGGAPDLLDVPDKDWRSGPARYLLTREEAGEFKKLKTDKDRARFIVEFWARRDPTPETERNEFKERYASRLAIVEERFAPPAGRGWEEDRGKVVLLLGAPDEIRVSEAGGASGPGDAGPMGAGGEAGPDAAGGMAPRPRARFVYARPPFPGAQTPLELEFVGESAGGFRLLSKLDTEDPKLNGLEPLPVQVAAAEPVPPAPGDAPSEPAATEPPPPEPPTPQEVLLTEALAGGAAAPEIDLATRLDFYKTKSVETFTTLTVEVKGAGSEPVVAARLLDGEEKAAVSFDRVNSFEPSGAGAAGGASVFQAAHNVAPGAYSMITAVRDPSTGKSGWVRQEVQVPDFSPQSLQISSVTLARKIEQVPPEPGSGKRFVLGALRVVPAADPVFRAGEEVGLYFQVYNTTNDPASGRPHLKISYKFEKVEPKRKIPLGREPIVQESETGVQAFAVPVAPAWPGGDYQVEVTVQDVPSGSTASAVVPFRVEKEG